MSVVPLKVRVAVWIKWHMRQPVWLWRWSARTVDAWHEELGR